MLSTLLAGLFQLLLGLFFALPIVLYILGDFLHSQRLFCCLFHGFEPPFPSFYYNSRFRLGFFRLQGGQFRFWFHRLYLPLALPAPCVILTSWLRFLHFCGLFPPQGLLRFVRLSFALLSRYSRRRLLGTWQSLEHLLHSALYIAFVFPLKHQRQGYIR